MRGLRRLMAESEKLINEVRTAQLAAEHWSDKEHGRLDRRISDVATTFNDTLKAHMAEELEERRTFTVSINTFSHEVSRLAGEVGILKVIGGGIFLSLIGLIVTMATK